VSVVTLAEAKTHLNITVTTYDAELQAYLDRCEAAIGRQVGPLASTATTAEAHGGGRALLLPTTPVISLTSVTDATGATLTVSDLHVTTDGVVSWSTTGLGWFGSPWYMVVYAAGRATLPDDLKLAVLEMVRHKWLTQRGSGRPGSAAPEMVPGAAYSFPIAVNELIAPHMQVS
jgi:hypothetical protein